MNIPILGDILEAGSDAFRAWNDGRIRIKEAKIEAEIAKWKAKANYEEKQLDAETNWDLYALKQMKDSWKDEFIMVLWFIPLIMLFIPGMQVYAIAGFNALHTVPYGYWLVVFGIVASTFGLRWLFTRRIEKAIKTVKGHSDGDESS